MTAPPAQLARNWRFVALRLLVVAAAIGVGLVLNAFVADYLAKLDETAKHDVLRARAELGALLRVVAVGLFGPVAALGVAMAASSRRAIAAGVFPPPGVWSIGSVRRIEGEPARRVARFLLVLAVVLVVLCVAGGGLTWYVAETLLACRAGVAPSG